jgi:hypothetical protein
LKTANAQECPAIDNTINTTRVKRESGDKLKDQGKTKRGRHLKEEKSSTLQALPIK